MEHMEIYEKARKCPDEALRTIQAGKLKGKSDINPMWRIKMLTDLFGPCGIGWKTENVKFWTTPGAGGEVIAWCGLDLLWFEKDCGAWSDPVCGIGGSMMVDTQKGNLTSNDEAYKMAYTDAISVACKALGFAADVYWQNDATKYDRSDAPATIKCMRCGEDIRPVRHSDRLYTSEEVKNIALETYGSELCWNCMKAVKEAQTHEAAD